LPRFSVILVHFQGATPHAELCRAVNSLNAQTNKDFEILAYHDGPLLDTSVPLPIPLVCMDKNYRDWGHSLRDRGIREAKGEYIVHMNSDNILYPNAIEEIAKAIDRPPKVFRSPAHKLRGEGMDTNDIIIFPILMHGLVKFRDYTYQDKKNQGSYIILNGIPPVVQNIDCMQLVMKRELWLREGGWHDKQEMSDGVMYEEFCQKYGYRYVGPVLGEHF
jgi:hypothetical protein